MANKDPSKIYAIQAYSKTLNRTKREFDEDALLEPYNHTVALREAKMKAESLASRLNTQQHGGVADWIPKHTLQDYKPDGLVRAAQIRNPSVR
jgi:hypothetical protein